MALHRYARPDHALQVMQRQMGSAAPSREQVLAELLDRSLRVTTPWEWGKHNEYACLEVAERCALECMAAATGTADAATIYALSRLLQQLDLLWMTDTSPVTARRRHATAKALVRAVTALNKDLRWRSRWLMDRARHPWPYGDTLY